MTTTVVDNFTGANAAPVSATIWNLRTELGGSAQINANKGRLVMAAGSKKTSLESITSYTRGEFVGSITSIGNMDAIAFGAYATSPYSAPYALLPINGYGVKISLLSGITELVKTVNEVVTVLTSLTIPTVADLSVINIAIRARVGGVDAWVWRDLETRPTTATLTSPDVTYTSGIVRPAGQSTTLAGTIDVDDIVWDDLLTPTTPPPDSSTRIGGVLVATRTRVRISGALTP